ncbi:MAG: YicC/YloC family endoribonuclease [Verrucomicrobiales bacterium]
MKSMTGFGHGEASVDGLVYRAEVSSVNRKQADIVVSLPRELAQLEAQVRERIGESVSRGRVNVSINVSAVEGSTSQLQVNEQLAQQYVDALRGLGEKLGLDDILAGFDPMRAPGVVSLGEILPGPDDAWLLIRQALDQALGGLVEMRSLEGEHLCRDLRDRLSILQGLVENISTCAPGVVDRYRENLHKRLDGAGLDIDSGDERVMKEIGLFAERSDISEEITRLQSHFLQCSKYFGSPEPVGRPLDFLAQEMNRELNTIGSKANDAGIAQYIVEAKTELEKIREQVQNIE